MSKQRDDPMRLWVGNWTPEVPQPRGPKDKDRKDDGQPSEERRLEETTQLSAVEHLRERN